MLSEGEKEIAMLLREQNDLLKKMTSEIKNLSLLFEKYDAEYQTEVENQGFIPEG